MDNVFEINDAVINVDKNESVQTRSPTKLIGLCPTRLRLTYILNPIEWGTLKSHTDH